MSLSKRNRLFIIKAWKNSSFYGSYSGESTFLLSLQKEYPKRKFTRSMIRAALTDIPVYTEHRPVKKVISRRKINFNSISVKTSFQMDLFQMPKFGLYTCGILIVDQSSNFIYTKAQKTKSAPETLKSFMDIFKRNNLLHLLQIVSSDQGIQITI